MGISVQGGTVGVPFLSGAIGGSISFTDTGAAPVSRIWSFKLYPSDLATPPAITNPTSTTGSFVPPAGGDGTWKLRLTRLESDSTTNIQDILIGVLDPDVHAIMPTPGTSDADFAPLGVGATESGFAGSAHAPQGDTLAQRYIRGTKALAKAAASGGADPEVITFDSFPTISNNRRMVWAGGAAQATLGIGPGPHRDGGQLAADFPANTATSLVIAPDYNLSGNLAVNPTTKLVTPWDATARHVVLATVVGDAIVASMRVVATKDTSAPTILGNPQCSGDAPTHVVITFSEVVWAASLAGMSLTGAGGRTFVSVSGLGTNTLTFVTSSAFVGTETPSVVITSANTIKDLASNPLAPVSSISVAMTFSTALELAAPWTDGWSALRRQILSSGRLLTWTGMHGGILAPTSSSSPAVGGDGACTFTATHTERIACPITRLTSTPTGDFAFFAFFENDDPGTHSNQIGFDDHDGNYQLWGFDALLGGVSNYSNDSSGSAGAANTVLTSGAVPRAILIDRVSGILKLQVIDSIAGASAIATVANVIPAGNVDNIVAGGWRFSGGDITSVVPTLGKLYHLFFMADVGFSSGQRAAIQAALGL